MISERSNLVCKIFHVTHKKNKCHNTAVAAQQNFGIKVEVKNKYSDCKSLI